MSWYVEAFAIALGVAAGNLFGDAVKAVRVWRAKRAWVRKYLEAGGNAAGMPLGDPAEIIHLHRVYDGDKDGA